MTNTAMLPRPHFGARWHAICAGIPCFMDAKHDIAHMIIDEGTVITASFNFTMAAEKHNAENLLVIQDAPLAGKCLANWQVHQRQSEAYRLIGGGDSAIERLRQDDKALS